MSDSLCLLGAGGGGPAVPPTSVGVQLISNSTPAITALLTWTKKSPNATYSIYRCTHGGSFGVPLATGVTGGSYTDTTIVAGTSYDYAVTGVNVGGESAKSSTSSLICYLYDAFVDANNTDLTAHTPNVGSSYTASGGTAQIQSNNAKLISLTLAQYLATNNITATTNLSLISVLGATAPTGSSRPGAAQGPLLRGQDGNNFWFLYSKSGGNPGVTLFETSGGIQIPRVSANPAGYTPAAGDMIQVIASGNAFSLLINGSSVGSFASSDFNAATLDGWYADATNATSAGLYIYSHPTNLPQVVVYGDSITHGFHTTDPATQCYPNQLQIALGRGWLVIEKGTVGQTMEQMVSNYVAQIRPLYNASAPANILILQEGPNSYAAGVSVADYYTHASSLISTAKADGWTVLMMTCIITDYPGTVNGLTWAQWAATENTTIKANAGAAASTPDPMTISQLQNPADTTYFVFSGSPPAAEFHITGAAHALIGPYVAPFCAAQYQT